MASTAACDPSQTGSGPSPTDVQRAVLGRDDLYSGRHCSWIVAFACAAVGWSCGLDVRLAVADEESASWSMCYRDRTLSNALAQAEDCLRTKATANGIVLLQWVLDQPFDCFIDDGTNRGGVSAKRKAERILASNLAAQYQRQLGADANALLVKAKSDADHVGLQSVVQRFFLTDAGYAATERLIAVWRDRGEIDLATALAERVLREPVHAARITRQLRRLAEALSVEAAGADAPGNEAVRETDELFRFGWMLSGGDGRRNRVVRGSVPLLRASWIASNQASLQQSATQLNPITRNRPGIATNRESLQRMEAEQLLKQFEVRQRDLDRQACSASFPIVVRDKIIVRSVGELRAIHVPNGQTAWSFACESSAREAGERDETDAALRREFGRATSPQLYSTAESWFENSRTGMLSSDGRFVYSVAESSALDDDDDLIETDARSRGLRPSTRNRLMAVPVEAPISGNQRAAWINDGRLSISSGSISNNSNSPRSRSAGLSPPGGNTAPGRAAFLGVPLPSSSELLCVTEQQGQIHLTSLAPSSGELLWTQPVCILGRSSEMDGDRQLRACVPARSKGVVIFPTNTGLVVALDLVQRRLLWVAHVDDLPNAQQPRGRGEYLPPVHGYAGFASGLVMAEGRVAYLPPRSARVHCLDQQTGKSLWTSPRRDGEVVSHIVDGRVLVVGRQNCQCLSLADGSELWSCPTGPAVGRGVCFGTRFILPVEGGRLVTLDMATGRSVGNSMLSSPVPLGHLIAAGNQVYSMSPRALIAFPQSDHVRAELDSPTAAPRTNSERELVLAEIDLAHGRAGTAETRLLGVVTGELPAAERLRARRHLKQLLLSKLNGPDAPSTADCDRLERLIETPDEQFQYLAGRFRHLPRDERDRLSVSLIENVYRLPSSLRYSPPGEDSWTISPAVWNRLTRTAHAEGESPPQRPQRTQPPQQAAWFEQELTAQEPEARLRFVRAFDDTAIVQPVRASLAAQLAVNGEAQAAETLWLRNRMSGDPAVAAEAAVQLSELWERAGFIDEAAEQLESLATEFAGTPLSNGMVGGKYVVSLPNIRLASEVWRRTQAPAWDVDRVEIVTSRADNDDVWRPDSEGRHSPAPARANFERPGSFARQFRLSNEQSCEFNIQSFPNGNSREENVVVMDRRTMLPRGSVRIEVPNDWPKKQKLNVPGHLFPIGLAHGAAGLSTLQLAEEEPVWTQLPPELQDRSIPTTPGPFGPTFASFLWRNRLFVVDPLDGELLWQRTLLLGSADRVANEQLEVTGDHLAIVVRSPDRSTFEVFETSTGRKLKSIRPGFDPGQSQFTYGRRLVGIVATPEGRRLQILDPLKDAPDVSMLIGERILVHEMGQGEFALLGMDGTLRVFDVPRGQTRVSVQFDPDELGKFGSFRVLSDRDRYYVNLWRQVPSVTTTHYNYSVNDSRLSGGHLRDDVYAFDRATGHLLWKRSLATRTTVPFPRCRVPFLVTYSVVKPRNNTNHQTLTVEVLSGLTGETIGYRENIRHDQLQTADYDPLTGTITLAGQTSQIELKFGHNIQPHDH